MTAPMSPVEVAASIGDHLCRTGYSFAGESTWMGTVQELDEDSNQLEFTWQTLGPELYGGTSGIALFLAAAWAQTRDPRFRRRAEEGIEFALRRLPSIPKESAVSLYSGAVGIAYAAARIGQLLERADLLDRARGILMSPPVTAADGVLLDVVAGAAGAAPALLLLSDWLGAPRIAERAHELGRRIVSGATRGEQGWSWGERATGFETARHLTGFAHGAAGMGWALLELYRHSGEAEFLVGAGEAFRYEDAWFQPALDNWPDFRDADGVDEPAPAMVAWCHGAPGIALSRILAQRLTSDDRYRRDIEAALRTTRRALSDAGGGPAGDFSLCHGHAGLADILLLATAAGVDPLAQDAARAALDDGAARWGSALDSWPCGVQRGTNPSLMLGLAGIGYTFLRQTEPAVPSVLCVGPAA